MANPTVDERIRHRRVERHGAAIIRAVSGVPNAEFRAHHLRIGDQGVPFAAPWLIADPGHGSLNRNRGVADSLGLRLRFSDRVLHRSLEPEGPFARVVFDILEQLRCEALVPEEMKGLRGNLGTAFVEWASEAEAQQVGDSSLGLLLYTMTHMARAGLIGPIHSEVVDTTIEVTRSNISPTIGAPLYRLRSAVLDQAEFATHALHVASLMDELAGHPENDKRNASSVAARTGLSIPAGFENSTNGEGEIHGTVGAPFLGETDDERQDLTELGGYQIWTTAHDVETTGTDLYPAIRLRSLRQQLDRQVTAQAVSVHRLAYRLQRLLGRPVVDGLQSMQEDGLLDPARLSQLVAGSSRQFIFRQPRLRPVSPAVVTFLIDQSGSMKRQRFETVAVLVDTFCRALDRAGASSEVLGFTTADWNGGQSMKDWMAAGSPPDPGRISELLHVVYKSADEPWRRARNSLAAMTDSRHFREGVDGEALAWAYQRIVQRPEPRKLVVLVSDGSPFEAASANNNRPGFMDEHIAAVARRMDRDPRVELGAIGIDLDMSPFVANSVPLDLTGTLGLQTYAVLETLFGPGAQRR